MTPSKDVIKFIESRFTQLSQSPLRTTDFWSIETVFLELLHLWIYAMFGDPYYEDVHTLYDKFLYVEFLNKSFSVTNSVDLLYKDDTEINRAVILIKKLIEFKQIVYVHVLTDHNTQKRDSIKK